MWIMTPLGALSIVLADTAPGSGQLDQDQLMVRARLRAHLELLQQHHAALARFPIIESPAGCDYRFRIVAPKPMVAQVLADLVSRIDYGNFKSAAQSRATDTGQDYVGSLHAIWGELRRLQK